MAVVVGFVDTPEGHAALTVAVQEARLRETRLVAVLAAVRGGAEHEAEALEESVRTALEGTGVRHEVRHTSRSADAAEAIVQVAKEVDAVLVVIGLRRRSAVGKLLLGSKAQRIVLDAPCPVLAVKGEEP